MDRTRRYHPLVASEILNPSALVSWWIGGLAVLVAATVAAATRRIVPGLAIAGLMAFQYWMAAQGRLHNWDAKPPTINILIVVTTLFTLRLAFSKTGAEMASRLPFAALIGFQAFRLILELGMHQAALEGTMPVQMSFSGDNFDIVTGVTAIFVAILAAKGAAPRWLLVVWNAMGFLLLVTIVGIAVASTPVFAAFGRNRLNTFIAYPPFIWLPCVLVQAALLGHILVWRKLRAS